MVRELLDRVWTPAVQRARDELAKLQAMAAREGDAIIQYFAVTDGATSFELSLNQKTMQWILEKTNIE